MQPMAPQHDRKRTAAAKITDHESTSMLQGMGFAVVRVETVHGLGTAHLTWRNLPNAHDTAAAEVRLVSLYNRFTHGT